MRRVEDDGITGLAHPVERAHVRDQIVVAESCAALGETKFLTTERRQFLSNIFYVPRRKKLSLLHVDRASGFRRRFQKIGLAAKKRGDLQQIDHVAGELGLVGRMNVRCYRNFQLASDRRQNFATGTWTHPAKRFYRSPVRFVVGRFEDKIDIFRRADFDDASRHLPNKLLRLNHARSENEHLALAADGDFAYAKRFHAVREVCSLRERSTIANGA